MTERPILFNAPMVRAILAGTKTQTRRAIKPQPTVAANGIAEWNGSANRAWCGSAADPSLLRIFCPHGQPGDQLWVRETFMHEPADYCWEASVSIPCRPACTSYRADFGDEAKGAGWKPSIHMPRALSRITLAITGVRAERLQDISEADAQAEGIEWNPSIDPLGPCKWRHYTRKHTGTSCPVDSYLSLWNAINGAGSADANPWVWVVEFRRVAP